MSNKVITARDIHEATGYRFSWINRHFGCIANDYFKGNNNTYNLDNLIKTAEYLLTVGWKSSNQKQNEIGKNMMIKTLQWLKSL